MKLRFTGSRRRTRDAIFGPPAARNLQWRNVRSMPGVMMEIVEEPNGNLKLTQNGHTLLLHRSHHKDVADVDERVATRTPDGTG